MPFTRASARGPEICPIHRRAAAALGTVCDAAASSLRIFSNADWI
jgi:hypothetical protein